MKLLPPKGLRIELRMPNGLDGEAEGYYEEEIDREESAKLMGNNWVEQIKEQASLLQVATGIPISFNEERNIIAFSFDGLKGKDALDMVVSELIGNSEFARVSLADLMVAATYGLAKREAEKQLPGGEH